MQKQFLKFRKVFTNIAFTPLILISNNSELAAKYLPNEVEKLITPFELESINNGLFQSFDKQEKNFFIAENKTKINQKRVIISEIIIEGWENHPEGRFYEYKARNYC